MATASYRTPDPTDRAWSRPPAVLMLLAVGGALIVAALATMLLPVDAPNGAACGNVYAAGDAASAPCDAARASARELPLAMIFTGVGLGVAGLMMTLPAANPVPQEDDDPTS